MNVGNDLVDVVLNIDAKELSETRIKSGDVKSSAKGAIDFMTDADWQNYDLRYILEVYSANETGSGEPIYRERLVNCLDKYAPTTFSLRLVPNRSYKFVVFADFVAEGAAEAADKLAVADLYYNTADLRNISAITTNPTWGAMNEVRDAYFISANREIGTTGLTETLTLERPFAKLRVVTKDLDYINGYSAPGYVEVKYHTEKVIKSFNAVNGKLNADEMTGNELSYSFNINKNIPYSEGYDALATHQTLFTDYLFAVEGQQTAVNFEIAVYESKGGRLIHSHDFTTQIPIQRNNLTTIIGDLLTTQANIVVDINDNFDNEIEHVVDQDSKVLATPIVNYTVEGNKVNLTWKAIANAVSYNVTVNNEAAVKVTDTAYSFTGAYETEYAISVVALPEDATYEASAAATLTIKTEAEPVVEPEEPTVVKATVAEFLIAAEDATIYELTGKIANVTNTIYGNFDLVDETGSVLIYGLCSPTGEQKYWAESGAKEGDTITVQTVRSSFNGTAQGKDAIFISLVPGEEPTPEPDPEPDPTPGDTINIAEVLALGTGATINGTIEGMVVSNMDLNNLTSKKGMYVQDETGALQFYLAANHTFAFGTKVKIDLSGAKLADYNGAVQISGLALDKITVISTGNTVEPKTVTMADFLANKYEGQYIAIEGVQVAEADLSKTWVMGGAHTSINVEDANGNKFVVFSSKYATYGSEKVAQGSGTIKGISSISKGSMQIIFAQSSDYADLTGERFGDAGGEEPTPDPEPEPEPEPTPNPGDWAGRDDFNTVGHNSSYIARKSTAGWVGENCAVQAGGPNDANPVFASLLGTDTNTRAWVMNGKTSAIGKITSPVITTGCGTLQFTYGIAFTEKNGYDFTVDIIQNGEVVKSFPVKNADNTKFAKFTFSEEVNVTGEFQIVITNNCPTKDSGANKDRVSIWDVMWTAK